MPPNNNQAQTDSAFANFLINKGIAKSELGANIIMIIFVILCAVGSYYIIW
jgi:hypothetical protein